MEVSNALKNRFFINKNEVKTKAFIDKAEEMGYNPIPPHRSTPLIGSASDSFYGFRETIHVRCIEPSNIQYGDIIITYKEMMEILTCESYNDLW